MLECLDCDCYITLSSYDCPKTGMKVIYKGSRKSSKTYRNQHLTHSRVRVTWHGCIDKKGLAVAMPEYNRLL
jgi:hypothetical protein